MVGITRPYEDTEIRFGTGVVTVGAVTGESSEAQTVIKVILLSTSQGFKSSQTQGSIYKELQDTTDTTTLDPKNIKKSIYSKETSYKETKIYNIEVRDRETFDILYDFLINIDTGGEPVPIEIKTNLYGIENVFIDSWEHQWQDIQGSTKTKDSLGVWNFNLYCKYDYSTQPVAEDTDGFLSSLDDIAEVIDDIASYSLADIPNFINSTVVDFIASVPILDAGVDLYNSINNNVELVENYFDRKDGIDSTTSTQVSSEQNAQQETINEFTEVIRNPNDFVKDGYELIRRFENFFDYLTTVENRDGLEELYESLLNQDNIELGEDFTLSEKNPSSFINIVKQLAFANVCQIYQERSYTFFYETTEIKEKLETFFSNMILLDTKLDYYTNLLSTTLFALEEKAQNLLRIGSIKSNNICVIELAYLNFPNKITDDVDINLLVSINEGLTQPMYSGKINVLIR